MYRRTTALLAGLAWAFAAVPAAQAADEIRVISDRTPSHLQPLFEQYEQNTGVKINAVFVDDGLIARLAARPTEADVVITSTADILEQAKLDDLIRPISSQIIAGIRPEFRDPGNKYVMLSYRARAIYVSKDRVEPGEITRYEQLAEPEWKGRVCIRSGYHRYNVSLFAQMAADRGLDWTRKFMTGLRDNLARSPKGNDRNQVRGIYEGVCDVAVANSYYMGIMLGRDDQRAWGESANVVFPDQQGKGSYVLTGGMALTVADRAVDEATKFMEFLVSDYGQNFIINTTYEYPVVDGIALPAVNRSLGSTQPDVKDGRFKANVVPLRKIEEQRTQIVRILDEIDFDRK
jgi:iron(III) transport system substrate-binding protein